MPQHKWGRLASIWSAGILPGSSAKFVKTLVLIQIRRLAQSLQASRLTQKLASPIKTNRLLEMRIRDIWPFYFFFWHFSVNIRYPDFVFWRKPSKKDYLPFYQSHFFSFRAVCTYTDLPFLEKNATFPDIYKQPRRMVPWLHEISTQISSLSGW